MTRLPILLLLPGLLFCATHLDAQCPSSNTFYNGVAALGSGDEVVFPMRPIGFPFPFCGTTYTHAHVTTNGHLYLSNSGVPAPGLSDFTATVSEFVNGPPRIAPLWNDLNMIADINGIVYMDTKPYRCTVTWKNAVNYGAPPGSPTFDIEAQLFPNGQIIFLYSPHTNNNSTTAAAAVGITGITPGFGATAPPTPSLLAGGSSASNILYQVFAAPLSFTMAGDSLRLAPTSPGWSYQPLGPPVNCAEVTSYGVGCPNRATSFYELMPPGGFDLNGATIRMIRTPTGYVISNAPPAVIAPVSSTAFMVAHGDDTVHIVPLSAPMPIAIGLHPTNNGATSYLSICSNGRITLSLVDNGISWTPAVPTFLNWSFNEVCAAWHDYNPSAPGSGKIWFEEVGGVAYVTWNGVYSYGTTIPDTFQVQCDIASGNITIVYQNISNAGNGYLVGYKVGLVATDPGSTDLSATLGPTFPIFDNGAPLTLSNEGLPGVGNQWFEMRFTNIPPLSLQPSLLCIGTPVINPGIPLVAIGMPGCSAYTIPDLAMLTTPPAIMGRAWMFLQIPNNQALLGAVLGIQGLALSPDTPLNLVASNGLRILIGPQ